MLELLLEQELVGQFLINPSRHEGRTADTWRVVSWRPLVDHLLVLL